MGTLAAVKQVVEVRIDAVEQAREFMTELNRNLMKTEPTGRVLPGYFYEDQLRMEWQVAAEDHQEAQIDFSDEEELDLDGEEEYCVCAEFDWSYKDDAHLLVFVEVNTPLRTNTWWRVKVLADKCGWRLMIDEPGWHESQLEVAKLKIEDDFSPELAAKSVLAACQQYIEVIDQVLEA